LAIKGISSEQSCFFILGVDIKSSAIGVAHGKKFLKINTTMEQDNMHRSGNLIQYNETQVGLSDHWQNLDPTAPQYLQSPENRTGGSLGRFRSLTRPDRTSIAIPRKDLLATEESTGLSPWKIFYNGVTCCCPALMLSKLGNMHPLEVQRAWREKVALCVICLTLMGALGFLTFGLNSAICEPEKISFVKEQVEEFTAKTNPNEFVIHGVVYKMNEKTRLAHQGNDIII
jgi:hypothetical protein